MSGQPCGCDPEAGWICKRHLEESVIITVCPICGAELWNRVHEPYCSTQCAIDAETKM